MSLSELKEHVHTLPEQPDLIPYRTSYYSEAWGFCMEHNRLQDLEEGEYEVRIDSSLEPGSLTYGELHVPGESEDEVLISCHCCHPSIANDNLSGIALATWLAEHLAGARPSVTRIASCSSPGRSGRSPGWPATRIGSTGSSTASWSPASAIRGRSPTSAAAEATP